MFEEAGGQPDLSFAELARHHLDDRSWVDVVRGWLHRHGELFDQLLHEAPWQQLAALDVRAQGR